jgi:hypothetical protein
MALVSLPTASFQPCGKGGALVPVLDSSNNEEGDGAGHRVNWSPIEPRPAGDYTNSSGLSMPLHQLCCNCVA